MDEKLWPGSVVWVTRRLKEAEANLQSTGIDVGYSTQQEIRQIALTKAEPVVDWA